MFGSPFNGWGRGRGSHSFPIDLGMFFVTFSKTTQLYKRGISKHLERRSLCPADLLPSSPCCGIWQHRSVRVSEAPSCRLKYSLSSLIHVESLVESQSCREFPFSGLGASISAKAWRQRTEPTLLEHPPTCQGVVLSSGCLRENSTQYHAIFIMCSQWESGSCMLASPCSCHPVERLSVPV